ncbi:MAG: HAD family phosphatase [Eubacteriales bacterium]|nr:HAD family phosphatase [Eubacteriales bacterium]
MIRTVVFDIGRVLMSWNPQLELIYDKETAKNVNAAIWKSGWWEELDRGVIPEEELFQKMVAEAPDYEKEIRYVLEHLEIAASARDYPIPWIKELKSLGYQVLFLSNYSNHLINNVPEALTFLPYMDGGVWSYQAKMIKPDPGIYEKLMETYVLQAEECLFIDDRLENVETARSLSMHSLQFISYEETYGQVMDYLEKNGITKK